MGWTISHGKPNPGGPFDGHHARPYGVIGEWRDALNRMPLSNRDQNIVEPLTRDRSGDPFTIPAARAGAIAAVLRGVVRRMPRAQRELTEALAAAAERAAAAGEPWRWS